MPFMAVMAGLNVASALGSYSSDKAAAKAQKREAEARKMFQEYRNTMTHLGNAINQNAITTNEIMADAVFTQRAVENKIDALVAEGSVVTSAGAAEVRGRSVSSALYDVKRNAAIAESVRKDDLAASRMAFDQQRIQSAMDAQLQQDYTYIETNIPKPKLGNYLIGAAKNTLSSPYGQEMLKGWFE